MPDNVRMLSCVYLFCLVSDIHLNKFHCETLCILLELGIGLLSIILSMICSADHEHEVD